MKCIIRMEIGEILFRSFDINVIVRAQALGSVGQRVLDKLTSAWREIPTLDLSNLVGELIETGPNYSLDDLRKVLINLYKPPYIIEVTNDHHVIWKKIYLDLKKIVSSA